MFLCKRFYIISSGIIILFVISYLFPAIFIAGKIAVALLLIAVTADFILLWHIRKVADAERFCAPRFSNGDDNEVRLVIENFYPFAVNLDIIDEIPVVFQRRDILFKTKIKAHGRDVLHYRLRPVKRGEYGFGHILL